MLRELEIRLMAVSMELLGNRIWLKAKRISLKAPETKLLVWRMLLVGTKIKLRVNKMQ